MRLRKRGRYNNIWGEPAGEGCDHELQDQASTQRDGTALEPTTAANQSSATMAGQAIFEEAKCCEIKRDTCKDPTACIQGVKVWGGRVHLMQYKNCKKARCLPCYGKVKTGPRHNLCVPRTVEQQRYDQQIVTPCTLR